MPDQPAWPAQGPDDKFPPAITFSELLPLEQAQIKTARELRGIKHSKEVKDSAIGLAFSGGGIRSATFNLGILQALAEHGLLRKIDYLSTVSGGGYIGSWLAALTKRYLATVPMNEAGQPSSFADIEAALIPKTFAADQREEPAFLHWLRLYSNYLTPHSGLISGDTWAAVGTWLRNVFLNQTILGLFFVALFATCQAIVFWLVTSTHYLLEMALGGGLLFVAAVFMGLNVIEQLPSWDMLKKGIQRVQISGSVMLPFVAACLLLNAAVWRWSGLDDFKLWQWALAGAGFYFLVWSVVAIVVWLRKRSPERLVSRSALLISSLFAGAAGASLLREYAELLRRVPTDWRGAPVANVIWPGIPWMVGVFGTGIVMLFLLVTGSLHLGLIGRGARDLVREWWARLGGYLMLITGAWVLLAGASAFGPLLVRWIFFKLGTSISLSAILLWMAHNYVGLKSASSAKTTGQLDKRKDQSVPDGWLRKILSSRTLLDSMAKVAPYVFLVGIVLILSTAVHVSTGFATDYDNTKAFWHSSNDWAATCNYLQGTSGPRATAPFCDRYWYIESGSWWQLNRGYLMGWTLLAISILIAAGLLLSWRVDVNDFSLHHFYRNRLVRCYLGASNPQRRQQPFTGFDPKDDIPLHDFAHNYPGPFPIVNAALNITTGEELGYATRRAKSFVFTPLGCGYELQYSGEKEERFIRQGGYLPSFSPVGCGRCYKRSATIQDSNGISLGTAMAISGAAASPNMGYFTTPATAFFMTLFDVRLGWWMGNPRYPDQWQRPGPPLGLGYLFSELLAKSDQKRHFVYLSDGGHFENLAAYELVKRRCKLIIACDADCDGDYQFENLLSLIEKARTDFGARIEIDFAGIRPVDGRESNINFVKGKIFYDPLNLEDQGTLIFIKASMPRRENARQTADLVGKKLPDDVWHYYEKHPTFPHQSTADQWFDELQFESYRALGEFIGSMAAKDIDRVISRLLRSEPLRAEAAANP